MSQFFVGFAGVLNYLPTLSRTCVSKKSQQAAAAGRVVSKEEVASENPDVIIGSWCGKKMKKMGQGYT